MRSEKVISLISSMVSAGFSSSFFSGAVESGISAVVGSSFIVSSALGLETSFFDSSICGEDGEVTSGLERTGGVLALFGGSGTTGVALTGIFSWAD